MTPEQLRWERTAPHISWTPIRLEGDLKRGGWIYLEPGVQMGGLLFWE